ncbi:MAG: hypothetical protein IT285_04315 [Bdellovibrionales bacterium]|nr:hypothetical protein [Bdellovibrionales bacterium]
MRARMAGRRVSFAALALSLLIAAPAADPAQAADARVLPKGRSRLSVVYGFSDGIRDVFNDKGQRESAVKDYNISLSAQNFSAALPDLQNLIDYLNATGLHYDAAQSGASSFGIVTDPSKPLLGDALERGFLNVGGAGSRKQYNLMYQYGLTDRLSLGFSLPFIKQSVDFGASITGSNTANDIYKGFVAQNPGAMGELVNTLNMVKNVQISTLQGLLESRGYSRVTSQTKSGIGDIVLGGRYNYLEGDTRAGEWIASAQSGVTVPTGKRFSPADVLAQNFGQGAWDISTAHIANFRPKLANWVMVSHSANYTHRFASTSRKRVRTSDSDVLPDASTEEDLDAQLGDKFWTTIGANFKVASFVSLDFNYEWYWKGQDSYQGSRAGRDYGYLSDDTSLYLETFQAGLTLSSIQAVLDYKFPLPGDLSFNYYLPVTGKNTVIAPFAAMELALYF